MYLTEGFSEAKLAFNSSIFSWFTWRVRISLAWTLEILRHSKGAPIDTTQEGLFTLFLISEKSPNP